MSFGVTQYPLAAQAADAKVRKDAEAILCKFWEENLPQYLLSMSDELYNDVKPMESRRLAGIVLKNDLGAKGSTVKEQPVQLWVQIDVSFKSQIKNYLLSTLGSTFREASHTAAPWLSRRRLGGKALRPVRLDHAPRLEIVKVAQRAPGNCQGGPGDRKASPRRLRRRQDALYGRFQKVTPVHEEAMLAIGALAYAIGPHFELYMEEFYNYLDMGLQNSEEHQVCVISVRVVGDICRALDDKILPYCDGIMTDLHKHLSSRELHCSVKPHIFSCFGDIALAIGEHFEKYMGPDLPMMQGASEECAQMDYSDEEMIAYGNQLRRSIFEAYSGILQGFKNSKAKLMLPHAPELLQFVECVAKDEHKAAVAVLGNLADALGSDVKMLLEDANFAQICYLSALRTTEINGYVVGYVVPRDDQASIF
ncbi:hypothetical protein OROMI_011651 [Orobanche minor]